MAMPPMVTPTSPLPAEDPAKRPRETPSQRHAMNSADPIVIVDAGLAGATAAQTLRAEGHTGPVVLIGGEPDAPYWRPPPWTPPPGH